ncbi:MAG: Druantia anti-phage system protein DruA, partial [Terrimicrobiaceae bacterium]
RRLSARDQWIGWSEEERRRRLPLVVNNCRFLLLPHKTVPNLTSRTLRLARRREGRYLLRTNLSRNDPGNFGTSTSS